MLIGKFVDEKGNQLENSPEFKQMVDDLKWALEKTKSYANSKNAFGNVDKAEELQRKYGLTGEVAHAKA
jgi:hypothetical protein